MARTPSSNDLTPAKRVTVALFLRARAVDNKLSAADVAAACDRFAIGQSSVRSVWRQRDNYSALVKPPRSDVRRSPKVTPEEVARRIAAVPLVKRQTLRSLAVETSIPLSTLSRYLSSRVFRRHVSRAKPTLTVTHKKQRLSFALDSIQTHVGNMQLLFTYCACLLFLSTKYDYHTWSHIACIDENHRSLDCVLQSDVRCCTYLRKMVQPVQGISSILSGSQREPALPLDPQQTTHWESNASCGDRQTALRL